MQDFRNKTVVITGGASGVGLALAERFAERGAKLVLADIEAEALDAAVKRIEGLGAETIGVRTDVTDFASVEALEAAARERFGKVHVLFNNAGVGAQEDVPIWELPLSDWRWVLDVNVWGVIHGVRAFVPNMIAHGEAGHVVNTSSGNGGIVLMPTTPIYSATKATVSAMTETLHLQLLSAGVQIKASVLYPGPHIVASNIFTARRNRQDRYAREVDQVAPPVSLEQMQAFSRETTGGEMPTTTPEEVAGFALEALEKDAYYILPMTKGLEARYRERVEHLLNRTNPTLPEMG